MQTIYKANHHTRFNFIGSDFCNSPMPMSAKAVLLYLIDKPIDWKLIVKNISNTLQMSTYAVRKALRWLLDHGYARYKRFTDGRTVWEIFEEGNQAATPVMTPRVEIPHVETQHDIHITQTSPITQKTTTAVEPVQTQHESLPVEKKDVVVHCEEIEIGDTQKPIPSPIQVKNKPTTCDPESTQTKAMNDVPHIETRHQDVVKRALSRLTEEQARTIIATFILQASKTNISNKPGYLIALVQSALNGSFSPVAPTQAAPTMTAGERIAKEKKRAAEAAERGKMGNQQYFEWLAREYGEKAEKQPGGRSIKALLGWS